ncbi:hypothetical protein NEOLEDRAFT_1238654 [Neolentinus lepideus HHB14362 ss-1]|uniref:Calcofluor white hypersensitive protein n=1 Tax=Neolentinus lepideus HHB14362 ss-1 TaxID=1314782 RepID=A0A165VNC8_9AGAM|nr:hypothetical protein NEOLEDRAFT_1238654 [Neolentinus lepideus HHB14362 ss-1]
MDNRNDRGRARLTCDASLFAVVHTYLAFATFFTALFLGCLLHYKKIVKNGVAGYPEEWFPSVSATIGDWYPERNVFQIMIALCSGPRFALVFLQYCLTRSAKSSLPTVVFISGIIRTISCGGWVYITSSDDHDTHDILMITYIVCNLPWMFGGIACTPVANVQAKKKRQRICAAFFLSMIPMVYFFIQHKVHRVPGAYTRYSFFEWGLIILDILYDSVAELDFRAANLQVALGSSLDSRSEMDKISVSDTVNELSSEKDPSAVAAQTAEKSTADFTNATLRPKRLQFTLLTQWRPAAAFLSDVYFSYLFWSIYTSLVPTLFYFSVWELGIAGHELALLSVLSPCLLGIPPFLTWARSHEGKVTLHALSFVGLAAYALPSPLLRLFAVAFANMALNIRQAVDWADGKQAWYNGILTGMGLIISSLSKHANHSNNPVWPSVHSTSGGWNKTGILLGLLSLYEFHTRPTNGADAARSKTASKSVTTSQPWLRQSIALGGLLFTLHHLLADSSTLIAWSWTGYPITGPIPNTHGCLTLLAQSLGLLLPVLLPDAAGLLSHPLWFLYGAASAYVTYCYKDWLGYSGGLNLAVFLMSIVPHVISDASATGKVGRTYFTTWLVLCLFALANVWTVAYAFVPGGVYLRERTDLVLAAQMAALGLAFNWSRKQLPALSVSVPATTASYVRNLLATLSVASLLVTVYRSPSSSPVPHRPGPRIIRAGIWTVHFGIDNEGRDSQRRIRDLIKDMELDIVGLLETDLHRIPFGNRDLTRVIAEDLGYYVDPGPGPNQHTWGAVMLSKFPIINSTHHLLPSPYGELAPAIEAVLDIYGTTVTVVVAHNGQEETPLDRELQSKELARIMAKSYPQPVIFLGYVVTRPGAQRPNPYEILISDGKVHDIDSLDSDRWCEYILYRGLYRTAYARVSRSTITDTELQIGQFVVPKYGHGVTDESEPARYLRSWKENLPEDHWFPMEYYGNEKEGGVRGHFYHVFNTPLYYRLPEGAIV